MFCLYCSSRSPAPYFAWCYGFRQHKQTIFLAKISLVSECWLTKCKWNSISADICCSIQYVRLTWVQMTNVINLYSLYTHGFYFVADARFNSERFLYIGNWNVRQNEKKWTGWTCTIVIYRIISNFQYTCKILSLQYVKSLSSHNARTIDVTEEYRRMKVLLHSPPQLLTTTPYGCGTLQNAECNFSTFGQR